MAQTTPTQHLPAVTETAAGTFENARQRVLGMFGNLRQSVLPSVDQPYTPVTTRSSQPRTRRQKALAFIPAIALGLAGVVLVLAVGMFVFRAVYDGRIYPAVIVGDVPVGGLTVAAAEQELAARAGELEAGTVEFRYGGQTWTPTLSELGVTVDLAGSLAEAETLGRTGDAATRLGAARELLQHDQVVPLRTELNADVLDAWFDEVDAALGQPAVNAAVVVEGTTVTVSPEEPGVQVDRAAATAVITETLRTLAPVSQDLPTEVAAPDVTAADLAPVIATVDEQMNRSMRVTFENRTWRVDGLALVPYLTVENVTVDGQPSVQLGFETSTLASALRELYASEINREPVNARVVWDNAVGLVAVSQSVDGVTVNGGAFAQVVADGFLNGKEEVKVPTVVVHPDIDSSNLAALGITNFLASGDSNFAGGSWERDENIRVAASLLNGTLVRPGAEFSFNDAIGEITADKGYQEAAVVVAEQIGRGIGGGVCQVSTTVFRAALLSGMPIGEWHAHTYRLTNYERDGWGPGFDASILQIGSDPDGWADFTFENFTDGWLYIQAYTDNYRLYVNIYGTDTGRSVDITKWGINNKSTGFTRVIYDADGNVVADRDFATTFK